MEHKVKEGFSILLTLIPPSSIHLNPFGPFLILIAKVSILLLKSAIVEGGGHSATLSAGVHLGILQGRLGWESGVGGFILSFHTKD